MRDYISNDSHITNYDDLTGILESCTIDGFQVDLAHDLSESETLVVCQQTPKTWQCLLVNNGKINLRISPYFSKKEAIQDSKLYFL